MIEKPSDKAKQAAREWAKQNNVYAWARDDNEKVDSLAALLDRYALERQIEVRREAIQLCLDICQRQANSLAKTLKETEGNKGSDEILRQQMASAAGCAWAIGESLPWVSAEKWETVMREFYKDAQLERLG